MKYEIYQEIDELIKNFSLAKEEIDQMYLDEGITDKSLEKQIADIEKELDNLATRYGMSAESRLLDLIMDSNRRRFIVINEMIIYEQRLENIEYQLEDSYCDDDTFLSLCAKYQEYEACLHDLQQEYLTYLDVDYEVDPSIVRGLDYYNHTVFELVADIPSLGSATTLCAGGRYNNLVTFLGGPDTPSIGFASGVDRLIHVLQEMGQEKEISSSIDVYVMAVNEEEKLTALRLIQDLRWSEVKCEMDTLDKGLKAQFKQADRLNARMLIILSSEDLQKGIMTVKDNLTKEETKVDESEILDYIISNLQEDL